MLSVGVHRIAVLALVLGGCAEDAQRGGGADDTGRDVPDASGARAVCSGCADEELDRADGTVRFHHVHLNVTSPEATTDFYQRFFDGESVRLNGASNALFLSPMLLLLNEVAGAPDEELVMGLDHFGRGSPDPAAWFDDVSTKGVAGDTRQDFTGEPTLFGDGTPPDGFTFVYVRGPNAERVEVYSNGTISVPGHEESVEEFQHVHFLTSDVDATVEWYSAFLDLPANPSNGLGRDIVVDRVALFFAGYPVIENFVPTDDRPAGHLALSVTDLSKMRERAGSLGLEIVAEPAMTPEGFRSFFVRAPDKVLLEVVEAGPL